MNDFFYFSAFLVFENPLGKKLGSVSDISPWQWRAQTFWMAGAKRKGTLVCVLAPKRAVYYVLTSQVGSLVYFANQEGILVHILAPKRAL